MAAGHAANPGHGQDIRLGGAADAPLRVLKPEIFHEAGQLFNRGQFEAIVEGRPDAAGGTMPGNTGETGRFGFCKKALFHVRTGQIEGGFHP